MHRVYAPENGHAHRWRLRHIKSNKKKAGFIDKVLLNKFYEIGCVHEVEEFNRLMEQLKVDCEDAW